MTQWRPGSFDATICWAFLKGEHREMPKANVYRLCGTMIALVGALLLVPSVAKAVSDLPDEILVVDVAFTSRVDGRDPVDRLTSPASVVPLNLWVRVIGDANALKRLSKNGLPLKHIWFYVGPAGILNLGEATFKDEIPLHVGRVEELIQKLDQEVQQKGSFDWRTWSRKQNLPEGRWAVRIVYANNVPVRCLSNGEIIDECFLAIDIQQ